MKTIALPLAIALTVLASPARAQSREVIGYAGDLGEWELIASVTGDDQTKEFSGPLTMRHVGICTQDGPEEKTGEIRLQISESSSRMQATLRVEGVECRYSGQLSESYTGTMNCADRPAVPLKLWVR